MFRTPRQRSWIYQSTGPSEEQCSKTVLLRCLHNSRCERRAFLTPPATKKKKLFSNYVFCCVFFANSMFVKRTTKELLCTAASMHPTFHRFLRFCISAVHTSRDWAKRMNEKPFLLTSLFSESRSSFLFVPAKVCESLFVLPFSLFSGNAERRERTCPRLFPSSSWKDHP